MKSANFARKYFDKKRKGSYSAQKDGMSKSRASLIYRQLINEGCEANDIIALSSHLISFVTTDLKMQKE